MYRFLVIFIFLILINNNISQSSDIRIKFKIDDEIITNLDILDEKNYLIFLRPKLGSLSEDELLKISQNSLIREIIKRKELKKVFKNLDNEKLTVDIKNRIFKFKKVNTENEFINLTKKNGIEYEKILQKFKIEGLWNELIFRKFNGLVKINRKALKDELERNISNNIKFEYNLSEILFDIDQNEKYETKYKKIVEFLKKNDFKIAATKFSISNSSERGGEIGWVKETLLSEELAKKIKSLETGQISKPIKYPNGYLILKLNEKKEMKQKIDISKELNEKIMFEKNKQLNQFSLLYYKKLKRNTKVNEY